MYTLAQGVGIHKIYTSLYNTEYMYVTLFYRKDADYLYVCEAILLLDLWINVLQT